MRKIKNPKGSVVHALIPHTDATYCEAGWDGNPNWLNDRIVTCKTCLKRMPKLTGMAVLDFPQVPTESEE